MSFTYNPKKRKRAKTHGFLVRTKTAGGRKTLKRRMQKGRKRIAIKTKR
jgi:large subunit ribosomal protein L34